MLVVEHLMFLACGEMTYAKLVSLSFPLSTHTQKGECCKVKEKNQLVSIMEHVYNGKCVLEVSNGDI